MSSVKSEEATVSGEQPKAVQHTRDNPYFSELIERTALTKDVSSKLTIHLDFDLSDAPIHYEPGDSCGIIAQNDPAFVEELLSKLPFASTDQVTIPRAGEFTIADALLNHYQATKASRKMLQHFANKTGDHKLAALLSAEQGSHLEDYLWAALWIY